MKLKFWCKYIYENCILLYKLVDLILMCLGDGEVVFDKLDGVRVIVL